MTRRENFLKTLRHEKHDRLPAFVVIDDFNYPQQLPDVFDIEKISSFNDPEGMVQLSGYYGMDTLIRMVPSTIKVEYGSGVNVKTDLLENGSRVTIWETPSGNIKSISEPSKEAVTMYMREHPVKEIEDYEVLITFIKSQEFYPDEQNIIESKRILQVINNEGIAYAVCPSTPIMDLTRSWVGLEEFIYHMTDEPELIKSVLDVIAENYFQQYELIARNTPCEVLVFWDDANSLYITPKMFEQFSIPIMQKYADISHKYGKTLVCHTCGNINPFLDLFLKTGVDAVDWVAPAPIGDVDPEVVQNIWGNRITMMLSTVPDIFKYGTTEQVEEHIHALLKGLDTKNNLVIMLTPPTGTPLENMKRAVRVLIEEYGVLLNNSKWIGNILD